MSLMTSAVTNDHILRLGASPPHHLGYILIVRYIISPRTIFIYTIYRNCMRVGGFSNHSLYTLSDLTRWRHNIFVT